MVNSVWEKVIVEDIRQKTDAGNLDNISRTVFYEHFFRNHPEIKWPFLASLVSRNAGYNMCDLEGEWLSRSIPNHDRNLLFLTYERANWLIFSDAYPQLLLYEKSKEAGEPLFSLLRFFNVSAFMQNEWFTFWQKGDEERLWTSLIINEQYLIQKPVIEHPVYRRRVFLSMPYRLQNWLHFSTVLFPTLNGEIYGFSVHGFRKVENRILLGRRLAWLLFQSPVANALDEFSRVTPHTGSRHDYEQYVYPNRRREPELLRLIYPLVQHGRPSLPDWSRRAKKLQPYYNKLTIPENINLTNWYHNKELQLQLGILLQELLFKDKNDRISKR
ncbi:Protein of unknown function [Fictibacillus solisalsi]|uniref:DUF2515 domain-containing protein n=1 Tax=Fictibacillus solisalsi TaxID=459525 RepID=A0A1G9VVQ4_9BACL|nr:DUF2515 family protein [Fictibacillus solisalsi]SDM76392.1 Protein of unknown function [Fictibacillus solisalsi]